MEFIVPKFIERELKIIGPMTFKQFAFVGLAGAICFVIYYTYRPLFWPSVIILGGGGAALAFIKIGGRPLPIILLNFFKYKVSPSLYIWKRKKIPVYYPPLSVKKKEGESPLEMGGGAELKRLKTQIETKKK
jgi:hypothetical protein